MSLQHIHNLPGVLCPACKVESDKRRTAERERSNAATRYRAAAFTPEQAEEARLASMARLRSQLVDIQKPYSDNDVKSGQWIVKMNLSDGRTSWPWGRRFMTEEEAQAFYNELAPQNGGV